MGRGVKMMARGSVSWTTTPPARAESLSPTSAELAPFLVPLDVTVAFVVVGPVETARVACSVACAVPSPSGDTGSLTPQTPVNVIGDDGFIEVACVHAPNIATAPRRMSAFISTSLSLS
jgi:hypothetical protein